MQNQVSHRSDGNQTYQSKQHYHAENFLLAPNADTTISVPGLGLGICTISSFIGRIIFKLSLCISAHTLPRLFHAPEFCTPGAGIHLYLFLCRQYVSAGRGKARARRRHHRGHHAPDDTRGLLTQPQDTPLLPRETHVRGVGPKEDGPRPRENTSARPSSDPQSRHWYNAI